MSTATPTPANRILQHIWLHEARCKTFLVYPQIKQGELRERCQKCNKILATYPKMKLVEATG